MNLSEFFEGRAIGARCTLCELIPKLSAERQEKVHAALKTDGISGRMIYETLHRWGHGVGLSTVNRHRQRCING